MKNKGLILILLAGGLVLFMSMRKKGRGYSIFVPEPDKLTQDEFEKPSLFEKASAFAKKAAPVVKKALSERKTRRMAKKQASVTGQHTFPDLC